MDLACSTQELLLFDPRPRAPPAAFRTSAATRGVLSRDLSEISVLPARDCHPTVGAGVFALAVVVAVSVREPGAGDELFRGQLCCARAAGTSVSLEVALRDLR